MIRTRAPRLSLLEIEAILEVAGDALAAETLQLEDGSGTDEERLAAFESGIDKLRAMLSQRRRGGRR